MGTKPTGLCAALAMLLYAGIPAYGVASWVGQPYLLSIPTHITHAGQSISGSLNLTLDHDAPCTLNVSVMSGGDEVLHKGTAVLTTSYKISSPVIPNGDADWVPSAAFPGHTYTVLGIGAADPITLFVKGTAPSQAAPDAGDYGASIVLTVTW
jgi:hypothetical protein